MKRVLLTLCALCASAALLAATETVNGIRWNYTVSNGTAEIAEDTTYLRRPAISYSISGAITIPSTLGGYPVTSIGTRAFSHCSGLTSVTIPDSVTSIGDNAFENCTGLTSVAIPDSVTFGWGVFSGVAPTILTAVKFPAWHYGMSKGNLTTVTIPEGTTSIPDSAFSGCSGLTSVTIPSSVTSIGNEAFSGCSGFTSIEIPSSVTSIGESAFSGCSGLTSVTIPDSVTSIGERAFSGCSGLKSVTIPRYFTSPSNVIEIDFNACPNLESITISEGGKKNDERGFAMYYTEKGLTNPSLVKFTVYSLETLKELLVCYKNLNPLNIILKQGGEPMIAVSGATDPNSFILKEAKTGAFLVFELNEDQKSVALKYVSSLHASIVIPDTARGLPVTKVCESAFLGCPNVQSIRLPPILDNLVQSQALEEALEEEEMRKFCEEYGCQYESVLRNIKDRAVRKKVFERLKERMAK